MTGTKLFLNGTRWWLRLPAPSVARTRSSTGTSDRRLAQKIADMVDDLASAPLMRHFISRVEEGQVTLAELYDHRSAGTLAALAAALDAALVIDPDLSVHLDAWIAEKQKSKKGAKSAPKYRTQVETLYPGAFPLSTFNRKEVRSRLAALDVDSPTRNRYKAAVSSFAKYLVLYDVLDSNFVRDIEGWSENDARMVYYSRAQAQRLLDALELPYRDIVAVMIGFGAEWCAVASLTPADIDLTPGEERIHLKGTKTKSRKRWVPLVRENAWVLPFLPTDTNLLGLTAEYVALRAVQRTARQLEIVATGEDLFGQHTLHDFRHTHAVQLLRDGYSEQIAAAHLGHKNTDMIRTKYGVFIPTREDYARGKPSTETT